MSSISTKKPQIQVSGDTEQQEKNQSAKKLILEWLADESGYDEEAWPVLKRAIEENRPSKRKRFDE